MNERSWNKHINLLIYRLKSNRYIIKNGISNNNKKSPRVRESKTKLNETKLE